MASRKQPGWAYGRYSPQPQRSSTSSPYDTSAPRSTNGHTSQMEPHSMPHVPSLPPMNTNLAARQSREAGQHDNMRRPNSGADVASQNRISPPPPGMSDIPRRAQLLHHNQTSSSHVMHNVNSSSQYYRPDQRHSLPSSTSSTNDYHPRHDSFQTESHINPLSFPSQAVHQQQRHHMDYPYRQQMYPHQHYHRQSNSQQSSINEHPMKYQADHISSEHDPKNELLLNYDRQPKSQHSHNDFVDQSVKRSQKTSPLHEDRDSLGDDFTEKHYKSSFDTRHQNQYQQTHSAHSSSHSHSPMQKSSMQDETESNIFQHRPPPTNDIIQPSQKRKRKPKTFTDFDLKTSQKKTSVRKKTATAEGNKKPKNVKRPRKKKTTTKNNETIPINLDHLATPSQLPMIGMNQVSAFQRPNSAPVHLSTADTEHIRRHGCNTFNGYIKIAEKLTNVWERSRSSFLVSSTISSDDDQGKTSRSRLIRILNDMGFHFPVNRNVNLEEIKRMSKVLVKIGLYNGSSNTVVNLPKLVSTECEVILKILDEAKSSLQRLSSQQPSFNHGYTLSDFFSDLNEIKYEVQDVASLNRELQLQLGKHFQNPNFVENSTYHGGNHQNEFKEVNSQESSQIYYPSNVDMKVFGYMSIASPLRRPAAVQHTASAVSSRSVMTPTDVKSDMPIERKTEPDEYRQIYPASIGSSMTQGEEIYHMNNMNNTSSMKKTANKRKKSTTKKETKGKRSTKKKKTPKVGSSVSDMKENSSETLVHNQSLIRGKCGKKSIKKLATKLNGKIVISASKKLLSKESSAIQTLCPSAIVTSANIEKPPPKKPKIFIEDRLPTRITNPLLQMPQYPHLSKGMASNTPIELIPNGAELWNLIQLYFPEPDTYPISYFAKILGFNIPNNATSGELFNFELKSLRPSEKSDDPFFQIPSLGHFSTAIYCKNHESWLESNHFENSTGKGQHNTRQDDYHLDFVDPMWVSVNRCHRGFNDDRFKAANGLGRDNILSTKCMELAKQLGILADGTRFRFANPEDDELLFQLNQEKELYASVHDFTQALKCPSQFFIVADDKSRGPIGFIHYKFCWYKLEENPFNRNENGDDMYGVGTTVSSIRQDSVSELVLCIEGIHYKNKLVPQNISKSSKFKEDPSTIDSTTQCAEEKQLQKNSNTDATVIRENENASIDNKASGCEKLKDEDNTNAVIQITKEKKSILDGESSSSIEQLSPVQINSDSAPKVDLQTDNIDASSGNLSSNSIEPEHSSSKIESKKNIPNETVQNNLENVNENDTKDRHLNPSSSSTNFEAHLDDSADFSDIRKDNADVLLLIALALEHARECDIWYGVHKVSCEYVQFLSFYFRMNQLPAPPSFSESTKHAHMACDLKKCSFRYAFLLFKDINSKSTRNDVEIDLPTVKERMLVRFYDNNRIGNTVSGSSEDSNGDKEHVHHYQNPVSKPRSKVISFQLNLQDEKSLPDHDNTEMEADTKNSWDVLKAFSIKRRTCQTSVGEIDDGILIELKKKQAKLERLESSYLPELYTLLQNVYEERKRFDSENSRKKEQDERKAKTDYDAVIERRKEADLAWQIQLEQDMDAVCDICNDGEVTVDNQIIFCESCNVAVHQKCYGISKVPSGDYFCHACRFFNRDEQISRSRMFSDGKAKRAPSPLPISCELCPRRQGAFLRCQVKFLNKKEAVMKSKWIHVFCAKWQGLQFVDENKEIIEDVSSLKRTFRLNEYKCCLCQGMRGAFNFCNEEGCKKAMHVTCARLSGVCLVTHGENHDGLLVDDLAWTLKCPEHSNIDPSNIPEGSLTLEQLEAAAKDFPPEPMPEPLPKPFDKQTARERKKYFEDPENEYDFVQDIRNKKEASRCEVCVANSTIDYQILQCSSCNVVVHPGCYVGTWNSEDNLCEYCCYKKLNNPIDTEYSHCHMCNQKGGVIVKSFAKPINRKRWKDNMKGYNNSLFGKRIWCHAICGMWHSKTHISSQGIDCSNIVMSNGLGHIESQHVCNLCGRKDKVKVACSDKECRLPGGEKNSPFRFHVTCARQAGLDVGDSEDPNKDVVFKLHCFHHVRPEFVFRAKLEDMIEIERARAGNDLGNSKHPMSLDTAAIIFNWGIIVLQSLGWAWRWAEWWVAKGDNWEPLIEKGEDESKMTKEQLRIVESTPESRRDDARLCRLASFGAALRNRDYDEEPGDDRIAISKALRSVFSTPSLVGPLNKKEIDFFVEWLARVYRSDDPRLGFGEHKTPVSKEFDENVFYSNGSPKYLLGDRPLPGKSIGSGQLFERYNDTMDDYDQVIKLSESSTPTAALSKRIPKKKRKGI